MRCNKCTCFSTHLHSGLNYVKGSVSKYTGSTSDSSKQTSHQRVNDFVRIITLDFQNPPTPKKITLRLFFGHLSVVAIASFIHTHAHTPLYQFLSTVMT